MTITERWRLGYDAWKTSPPEPEHIGYCDGCGSDVFAGEPVLTGESQIIHVECAADYLIEQRQWHRRTAGERED